MALGLPPTNLSFHLKGLSQAGLVSVVQEGRYQRYRANLALMLDLVAYLTDECCGGHPEECAGLNPAVLCAEVALCPPVVFHLVRRASTSNIPLIGRPSRTNGRRNGPNGTCRVEPALNDPFLVPGLHHHHSGV